MNLRPLFFNHVAQVSPEPLGFEPHYANGIYIYDANNKAHIDCISGISVSNLGHTHPVVQEAIAIQSKKYLHTMVYGEHIQSPQVLLSKLLANNLPSNLNCTYFLNSGTEATEATMKLVKKYTNRKKIVAMKNAYHGSTQGSLSLMSNDYFTDAYKPLLPNIAFMNFNNLADVEIIDEDTAAVFVEIVKVESGVILIDVDFLKAIRQKCNETGALLVLDEIQTGVGRTGKLFAFEHFNIIPDILLLGKALGAGLPLSAVITSKEIMASFSNNPILGHITTFGGNPLCCAAALAQMEFIINNKELYNVCERETLFRTLLQHKLIKKLNSFGFLFALELDNFELVQKLMFACLKNGLLVDWFLFNNTSIRLAPPLIITKQEIELACNILLKSLNEIEN